MGTLATALVFEPLTWATWLSAGAAALLLMEAVSLLGPLRVRARAAFWSLAAGAAGGGLLLAWLWVQWAGQATPLARPLWGELGAAERTALWATLAALAACGLLVLAATVHRVADALAGAATIGRLLVGLGWAAGLLALLGATAFRPPQGAVAAWGVAAAAWAARSYRRTTSPLSRRTKGLLLGLRVLVLLLLAAWAARPAVEYRRKESVRTAVLLCADTSSSMQRRDHVPAGSAEPVRRIEAVRRALDRHDGALAALADQADLTLTAFSAGAAPPESYRPEARWSRFALGQADGQATALGDSLAAAAELPAGRGQTLSAIVLISDGCNNTSDVVDPDKLAALMGARGVPVHTVGVGSEQVTGAVKTLTVRDLAAPDEVDAFHRLPIAAVVEAIGLEGRRVKISCHFGTELVGSETLSLAGLRRARPVRFVHVPLKAGFHRARISAEVVGGEPDDLAGRPEASQLVHVVDREMRILYVEGKFRFEAKYVTRALAAARRFSVDRRILLRPLGDNQPPPLSEELDDWLAYHGVILGDVAASHFTPRQHEILRDVVGKYGKGLCMLGGQRSFGRGGWQDTPLADVLPVDLATSNRQIDEPVPVVPTAEGRRSDLMRIGEDGSDPAAAWARLDPLPGANRLGRLKPAATVLAETAQHAPLIVTQPYGKGRAMAVAFDTTWRWVLTEKDTADLQRRFWRQVCLHLAAPKGSAWIVTDQTRYDLRRLRQGTEAVRVRAGVEDARGRPLLDTPVDVTLLAPGGARTPLGLQIAEKARQGRLPPPTRAGLYTLKIEATVDGKPLTAEHQFEVLRRDLESMDVLANHGLLRRLAAGSDGTFVPLERFGELLAELRVTARPERRDRVTHVPLAARLRWPILAALIALLCAEWALRKRKGLV